MESRIIYNFNKNSDLQNWIIVDDVVMGGQSSGTFSISANGFGVFEGVILLANNGGFSSVKYGFPRIQLDGYTKILLKIQGDGKAYQFRLKSNSEDYYSYIASFNTSRDWQEIEINLKDMFPSFRGKQLEQPNFSDDHIEVVTFLIANKKNEKFKLLIAKIELQ
ncbi:Complex I intermediate-associated protein 30 (CIA30) [Aequorivita sublithincola DSM 14238]|uniref:Complex I intermediate-associated protein 30 (CIA30) n=1 Tax=Aequorivita sublithincola (strain DSM 14238 / LMG 21431 / ACAM 643 / 9-3) TaxID=746697 RepID=I3YX85_AEQSU|nr:CIA30 family protein [Aequorivita sublithincola]AFL81603.1 Complex I intermediate-associated protein 30 (CIA30) [Aequorivita sublithincola DSM 14238]